MGRTYQPKLYWHIHHDKLVEFATESIKYRRKYIKTHKPENEVAPRLKYLKPVLMVRELDETLDFLKESLPKFYARDFNEDIGFYLRTFTPHYHARYLSLNLDEQIYYYMIVKAYQILEDLHKWQCPSCTWDDTRHELDFTKRIRVIKSRT